ncbi:MAG TPA: hypothetical protein PKD12_02195 [Nitrospira sp.]|nr:hypothetical protein [Nitrospira sp.]
MSVSTLVVHTYYHLPSIQIFRSFETSGLSYSNDRLADILTFTVSPDEIRRMVEGARQVRGSITGTPERPSLSFTAVFEGADGLKGSETIFSREAAGALHQALSAKLDSNNGIGAAVLKMQHTAGYPDI